MRGRASISFTPTVGVAPGTTTVGIAGMNFRVIDPYQRDWWALRGGLGEVDTRARIRWDIIGVIGGGALLIATLTSLLANAVGHLTRR